MDLISWSLSAIDTLFSTRSRGSGEPSCPEGTFAAGYMMDRREKWGIMCLATLSLKDVEDIYILGAVVAGILLIGLGGTLWNRRVIKAVNDQSPSKLTGWIETEMGKAASTHTAAMDGKLENITVVIDQKLENNGAAIVAIDHKWITTGWLWTGEWITSTAKWKTSWRD